MGYQVHSAIIKLQDAYRDTDWISFLEVLKDCPTRTPAEVDGVLDRLQEADPNGEWTRKEVVSCMKELADFGFGKFVKGVKSKNSRIEWLLPPRLLHQAVMGRPEELEQLMEGLPPAREAGEAEVCGKSRWTLDDLLALLSRVTGLPSEEIRIDLTLPETRRIVAKSQDIPLESVAIQLSLS